MAFKVLTGLFGHESNAFSKLPTTVKNFEDYLLAFGDDVPSAIKGAQIEPTGVEQAAAKLDWELTHTVVAWATPSGPLDRVTWKHCVNEIIRAAMEGGPYDGVLLNLHGAMATDDYPDAEGTLLHQLRGQIGFDVPVTITLDLHANVTTRMAELADIICTYRTYPHIDQVDTALRAADILDKAMRKKINPKVFIARRAMIDGMDHGRTTTDNPMTELLSRAERIESDDNGVQAISLHAGYVPADLEETGPSVCVTGDGKDPRFQAIAEEFMDYVWETRHFDSNTYLSTDETVSEIARLMKEDGDGPIVIADFSDNPGSGAYGDSTFLLCALLDAGIKNACFGTICDPACAATLIEAGVGAAVSVDLGGKIDPTFGPPISVSGIVKNVSDGVYVAQGPRWKGVTHNLGPSAVLDIDGLSVLIASKRLQLTEIEAFTHIGLDPLTHDVVVVKSKQHFRAAFDPIARAVLICDAGGLSGMDIAKLPFTRLRRPIFPLDLD